MSRSPAKSRKATAMKSLKEKWLSIVQSAEEKGEKEVGGFSTVTLLILDSVHEVVEVVGNQDKWSPRRGTRLLGN